MKTMLGDMAVIEQAFLRKVSPEIGCRTGWSLSKAFLQERPLRRYLNEES